jgi:hypothetical protein
MAERRKTTIGDLDILRGGYNPLQRAIQSELARTPGAFDYSELDAKYPMRQVTPMVPSYIEQEMEEDRIAQKEVLATQRIREAQASIYESKLNEQIETADQVQLAREVFSQLDPQDPEYPQKRDKVFMDLPFAENDTSFMRSVVARNDRLYENYFKKNLAVQNLNTKDVGEALKEIAKFEEIKTARGTEYSEGERKYVDQLMSQVDNFYSSQGVPKNTAPTTGSLSFSSVEEADSAGLPSGTIVYINGRKARID